MDNPIFLVSTGRTGTKFFSKFFSDYAENVESHHTSKYTEIFNIIGNMYLSGILLEGFLNFFWKKIKSKKIKNSRKRYIECNPYYLAFLNIIAKDFPKAKFIIIVRSPKDYCFSHIKKEKQSKRSFLANTLIPYWQPMPYLRQLKNLGPKYTQKIDYYSNIWQARNKHLLNFSRENDNCRVVKFESIFNTASAIPQINELIAWLGQNINKNIPKEAFNKKINATEVDKSLLYDNETKKIILSNCAQLMQALEYKE